MKLGIFLGFGIFLTVYIIWLKCSITKTFNMKPFYNPNKDPFNVDLDTNLKRPDLDRKLDPQLQPPLDWIPVNTPNGKTYRHSKKVTLDTRGDCECAITHIKKIALKLKIEYAAVLLTAESNVTCRDGQSECKQVCIDQTETKMDDIAIVYCRHRDNTPTKGFQPFLYARICQMPLFQYTRPIGINLCCADNEPIQCVTSSSETPLKHRVNFDRVPGTEEEQ